MKNLFLIVFCLASCATAPIKEPTPLPPTEVKYAGLWPNEEYTKSLSRALDLYGGNLLKVDPRDADEWCFSKYKDSKQFYITLISAMSKFESGWNPNTSYTENFKDRKGNFVVSVGLMQVSSESCSGYGMPYLVNSELKKIDNNFMCTVKVFNKWVPQHQVISQSGSSTSQGAAKYWSVIRTGSTHKREQIKAMVCK